MKKWYENGTFLLIFVKNVRIFVNFCQFLRIFALFPTKTCVFASKTCAFDAKFLTKLLHLILSFAEFRTNRPALFAKLFTFKVAFRASPFCSAVSNTQQPVPPANA